MASDEPIEVKPDEEAFESAELTKYKGVQEYSVSGWAKWKDPAKVSPWHILFRLTVVNKEQLSNLDNPGDRTLALFKGNGFYHFSTYSCLDEENNFETNVVKNIDYESYLHFWTYFYFGYSK
jgi:hypothetical protein